jgi:hypothetical protein
MRSININYIFFYSDIIITKTAYSWLRRITRLSNKLFLKLGDRSVLLAYAISGLLRFNYE